MNPSPVAAAFAWVASELVESLPDVEQGRILRSNGLKTSGKFFAFVRDDELVVKVPGERVRALIGGGAGQPFRSGGRVMREWVTLEPADAEAMAAYVIEAHDFVAALNAERR